MNRIRAQVTAKTTRLARTSSLERSSILFGSMDSVRNIFTAAVHNLLEGIGKHNPYITYSRCRDNLEDLR